MGLYSGRCINYCKESEGSSRVRARTTDGPRALARLPAVPGYVFFPPKAIEGFNHFWREKREPGKEVAESPVSYFLLNSVSSKS